MAEVYADITVEYGTQGSSVSMSADHMAHPATGQADERLGEPKVPAWHNDVRFFRDVRGYPDVRVALTVGCAVCGGTGAVPYRSDMRKPAWCQRTKKCPGHFPTQRFAIDPDEVPSLA